MGIAKYIRSLVGMSNPNAMEAVLHQTRQLLARPDNNFGWSHWNSIEEALREFDALAEQLQAGDKSRERELELLFAPTGSIQEVSLSSGWGEEFLDLAARFDALIKGG